MNRNLLSIFFALTVASLLAACTSEPADWIGTSRKAGAETASSNDRLETDTGLPCDVEAVLKERCQTCHGSEPISGAKTALVTWADLQKPAPGDAKKKVADLVAERIRDDEPTTRMPPSPKPALDALERSTLDMWLSAGAPESTTRCEHGDERAPHAVKPLSCAADTTLKAKAPYTLPPNAPVDQYVCFGVDYPLAKKKHIVGFAPKIDNAQLVHHVLLFQADKAVSPDPFLCPAAGLAPWKLVAGWNPGANNLELPPEAGFPAEQGTTHWVLQIHYNNASAKGGTDQSGYELCTTETLRKFDAGIAAFGSTSFTIPPKSAYAVRCDYPLGQEWNGAHLFNASPHMHGLGVAMSSERVPANKGAPERFLDQKSFSFDAQTNFPVSVSLGAGDVIRTRCAWKNPTDAWVGFGESSVSEMCFDFIGYYPRIASLPWVAPSVYGSCAPE